jgi:hypothetical protein
MSATEQRREPRYGCTRSLEILPFSAVKDWRFRRVELTDCSAGGIGFVAEHPLLLGEQFQAKLDIEGEQLMLIYTVRHCRPDPHKVRRYRIGAEYTGFIAAPNERDPEQVLAELLGLQKRLC